MRREIETTRRAVFWQRRQVAHRRALLSLRQMQAALVRSRGFWSRRSRPFYVRAKAEIESEVAARKKKARGRR
jgi:hypothetical protein